MSLAWDPFPGHQPGSGDLEKAGSCFFLSPEESLRNMWGCKGGTAGLSTTMLFGTGKKGAALAARPCLWKF